MSDKACSSALDLTKLYHPSYDRRFPTIMGSGPRWVLVRAACSSRIVRVPTQMSGKLAHLIGVIIGDGYVSEPIVRRTHGPGFHWKIVVTGPHAYVMELNRTFSELFRISGGLRKDDRKRDAWQLRFGDVIIHRFFTRVIGLPMGRKKKGNLWSNFDMVRRYPFHFLSGLIDSDGHIGKRYIGIIQKDAEFLERLRRFIRETTGLDFHGPHVNKRREDKITSWIISLHKREERAKLLQAKNRLGVGLTSAPLQCNPRND